MLPLNKYSEACNVGIYVFNFSFRVSGNNNALRFLIFYVCGITINIGSFIYPVLNLFFMGYYLYLEICSFRRIPFILFFRCCIFRWDRKQFLRPCFALRDKNGLGRK